jgi:8-oxo-dGTP pyrophosphatase MutT (NUDIX family)
MSLALWRAATQQAPACARAPLSLAGQAVGSVAPGWQSRVVQQFPDLWHSLLAAHPGGGAGWSLRAPPGEPATQALALLAGALRGTGLCGPWRDELLCIEGARGEGLGEVERALVRVLGLTTQAVHLVGAAPDGRIWVQQRSFTKPNDPGLWDTLVGGTVSAGETVAQTLERETWEEAGMPLARLTGLRQGGCFHVSRPTPDGGGAGHLEERTFWFTATLTEGSLPVNRDGEVDHFELWTVQEVRRAMEAQRFTGEARWALALALGWAA